MKKVICIIVFLVFNSYAQAQKLTKDFLVGTWTSDTVQIDFSIINKNELNVVSFSYLTGNYFKILGYQFDKNNFYLDTLHEQNNWEAVAKFIYVDENTMVADYVSDAPGQVIYKRTNNK
jgi:hypothetical protein